jgi:predicted DNA-binding transcriptional regulator YafY
MGSESMPRKIDTDKNYGQKLITLFAQLLFSGESHSLTELANMLNCSKATVMRLVDDITLSYLVPIQSEMRGNRRYYSIARSKLPKNPIPLSTAEMSLLQMCGAFTRHLLGKQLYEEITHALFKSQALLSDGQSSSSGRFASFQPGSIDYTAHQEIIRNLLQAMEEKRICKVGYQRIMSDRAIGFFIKPLKIFSYRDTVYLHARQARNPGEKYIEPEYDPLLAVHRIKRVELTERRFEFPEDYDFEKIFNQAFGIMKGEPFEVEAEFWGWAAYYVAERIYSPGQKIEKINNEKVKLTFISSSVPEIVTWFLSFGDEVKLIKPEWLSKEIADTIGRMQKIYSAFN